MKRSKVSYRCSCGASASASSNPPAHGQRIIDGFRGAHEAEGHHEVDAAEYAKIRARQRREEAKALREASR